MKHILTFILFICCLFNTHAQDLSQIKKSTIGIHFFYNDFKTAQLINSSSLKSVLKNKQWNEPQNMEGGFGIDYIRGLTKNIDLIGTLNASWVDYLLPNNTLYGSSNFLLDLNAGAHIKMLTDKHVFSPFLIAKANYTSYENISGFSLAPGAGLQINLFKEAFVLTTIEYRAALSKRVSNQIYYSIGIATSIGKRKTKPAKVVEATPLPEPVKKEIKIPSKDIIIAVLDEATSQPLPYVDIVVSGPEGKRLSGSTDAFGKVTFNAMSPADYTVSGLLNNINTSVQNIKKSNFETNDNSINITLTHNDPRFTLSGVVINRTKNIPEGGADINVTNETKHSIITKQSHAGDGIFRAQLEAVSDFTVVAKKASYISNIEKISTKGLNRSATLYVKLELGIEEAKVGQSIVLKKIFFEVGKENINTAFSTDLDKLIQFLKDNPDTRLEIQGHTDNTGSIAINAKLSQARANKVVNYLTKNGIASNRLSAKGYGPTVPIANNATAEGRAQNRRVEMKVLK